MAPEQANCEAVDRRADLFSFGVVLYEMTTGQRPFKGETAYAILTSIGTDVPEQPCRLNALVPPDLSNLIMTLVEKEPGKRPASADVVAEMFRRMLKEKTSSHPEVDLDAKNEDHDFGTGDDRLFEPAETPRERTIGSGKPSAGRRIDLLRRMTCPHCWKAFAPEEVLWISMHPDLVGDPRLDGPRQDGSKPLNPKSRRFLPSRFTVEGEAIDVRGHVCHDLACPHCHLAVPRAFLEFEPTFVSILGTPGCGKSFYLAALTWEMRSLLPARFKVACGGGRSDCQQHPDRMRERPVSQPGCRASDPARRLDP